jgi:hypothetical protein
VIDDDLTKGGQETVLLENVEKFELRYLGPGKEKEWVPQWISTERGDALTKGKFPFAVEITIEVQDKSSNSKDKPLRMTIVAAIRNPNNPPPTQSQDPNNPNAVIDQSSPVPGRAGGGPVAAGQSYMTGEHGRELFVPQSSGYIYNANDTQGIGEILSGVSLAARAIKDFASSLADFVFPKSEPMSVIQSAALTSGASQTDTQAGAYNTESTAALMNTRTSRIELVVTGESDLPMDRQKLRELAIMLGRELNLSGALLTMG